MESLPAPTTGRHLAASALTVALLLLLAWPLAAQQVHRNGFESPKTSWVKGSADAVFDEKTHTISDDGAHDGQRSEYISLQAQSGNFIYYLYGIGQGPLSDEFNARVWVKANRPGIQFMARLILPKERDPNNLENRLSTLMRGEVYRNVGRWQQLEIPRAQQLAKQIQQLMQAQLKRQVDFTDAYIDSLVLNTYAGPGPTEVWIDDLEVGPVLPQTTPARPGNGELTARPGRNQVVEFNGNQLMVGGKRILFRGIRHTDTPARVLRDAGFNTLFLNYTSDQKLVQEAVDLGFWLVPQLKVLSQDPRVATPEGLGQEVSRYADNDAVLFWHLGGALTFDQAVPINRAAQLVKAADPGRPLGADVWDGLVPYSRSLNLLGAHRWPLMTTLELPAYREWLDQRRRLAQPGTFMWTWIQTHMPDAYTEMLYENTGKDGFNEPVGPQAEQIRLLTYMALAAGYKGLGFWSDRWLADSHQGRDRLLGCGLLNQELDVLEPFLLVDDPPQWVDTSVPDVKAAIVRTPKGVLVLPIWLGQGGQFVPGQAAVSKLTVVVPQIPQSMQAWDVTPADVRSLRSERVVGGSKITVPEFGITSAIVFTADNKVVVRLQEQTRSRRQLAAQWSYDMALYELEKVRKVHDQLVQQGLTLPDATHLMQDADNRLRSAKQLWDSRNFAESYHESQRALRPMRIVMRSEWEKATKMLDTPAASPYAVSYFSLPRHMQFMDQVRRSVPTANVLPGGDFEIIPERVQEAWKPAEPQIDEVEMLATRVSEISQKITVKGGSVVNAQEPPHEGKQCAMLQVKPRTKTTAPAALERAMLALVSPTVKLPPGTLVQVSGWVRILEPIKASPDGALFYDSAGGDSLGVRLTEPTPWKKFTLYRRIPASGTINVTVALSGLGTAYFDDIRIEPLVPNPNGTPVGNGTK